MLREVFGVSAPGHVSCDERAPKGALRRHHAAVHADALACAEGAADEQRARIHLINTPQRLLTPLLARTDAGGDLAPALPSPGAPSA